MPQLKISLMILLQSGLCRCLCCQLGDDHLIGPPSLLRGNMPLSGSFCAFPTNNSSQREKDCRSKSALNESVFSIQSKPGMGAFCRRLLFCPAKLLNSIVRESDSSRVSSCSRRSSGFVSATAHLVSTPSNWITLFFLYPYVTANYGLVERRRFTLEVSSCFGTNLALSSGANRIRSPLTAPTIGA